MIDKLFILVFLGVAVLLSLVLLGIAMLVDYLSEKRDENRKHKE